MMRFSLYAITRSTTRSFPTWFIPAACLLVQHGHAQTIVQNVDMILPCSWDGQDSIDLGLDGSYDLRVYWLGGFDNVQSYMDGIPSNYAFAYPVEAGEAYGPFWGAALLTQTTIGCYWSDFWLPNTGLRYVGFKRINAPMDTTYGWVEADFYGDPASCSDTLAVVRVAYNSTPNTPLPAGDVFTGVETVSRTNALFFDRANNELVLTGGLPAQGTLVVVNALGQRVLQRAVQARANTRVPLGGLGNGFHVATLYAPHGRTTLRFIR